MLTNFHMPQTFGRVENAGQFQFPDLKLIQFFFSWQDFHQFASDKLMIRNEQDIFHQQGFSFRLTKSAILVSKALPQNHSTPFSHFPTDGSWITVWKLRLSYTSNLRSRERNETGRNLHLSLSSRLSRPWKRWIWRLEGGLLKVSR